MNALGPIPLHQTVVLADNHGCDSFGFGMAGSEPIGPESVHRGATQVCAEEQLAMIGESPDMIPQIKVGLGTSPG